MRALAIASLFRLEIGSNRCLWQTLQTAIDKCNDKAVRKKWLAIEPSLSMLDVVLLEYCCGTGEMRNHEALHAHVDANRSHYIESMTMFGRVKETDNRTSSIIVKDMLPGYLSMVCQGFAFKLRCGRDVIHAQLSDTMHCADTTRDKDNFSWVHGP